jgi:hypothetical protein
MYVKVSQPFSINVTSLVLLLTNDVSVLDHQQAWQERHYLAGNMAAHFRNHYVV